MLFKDTLDERIKRKVSTSFTDEVSRAQKPTMETSHMSQHVTDDNMQASFRAACFSQVRRGGGGKRTSQHSMLVRVRSARPTCGNSSTASERGTAANALYACLTFIGNSSGEEGEGARGCRGGSRGWGRGGVGYGGWIHMIKEVERTNRDMERADNEKNQQSSRRLWRRRGEQHGGWFHVEEEERCRERRTVGLGQAKQAVLSGHLYETTRQV